jgi:integrase
VGHRDATAILLAYRHGLRASEVVALRWDDIEFQTGKLHVRRSKGGQVSVHPLGGKELRALRRLQLETREGVRTWDVFVSERLAPLSVAGYQRMVARAGAAAGFPFLVHSHMLRPAPATSWPMTGRTRGQSSTTSATSRLLRRCAIPRWPRIGSSGSGTIEALQI